jgi:uncharacterized protein (TIGR02118 family)
MRRRQDVALAEFRRHWLDVHGPLVCRFPSLRHYVQHHVITSPAMNVRTRDMRVDGLPILRFDSDIDRQRAHASPEMAACNVDSRAFIGAVSRVICEPHVAVPESGEVSRIKLIALLPGESADDAALQRYATDQGAAPNSTIPHLPVSTAGLAELAFGSLVDLECALADADTDAAHFVVEEHRLA